MAVGPGSLHGGLTWLAVEELELSYYRGKLLLFRWVYKRYCKSVLSSKSLSSSQVKVCTAQPRKTRNAEATGQPALKDYGYEDLKAW